MIFNNNNMKWLTGQSVCVSVNVKSVGVYRVDFHGSWSGFVSCAYAFYALTVKYTAISS